MLDRNGGVGQFGHESRLQIQVGSRIPHSGLAPPLPGCGNWESFIRGGVAGQGCKSCTVAIGNLSLAAVGIRHNSVMTDYPTILDHVALAAWDADLVLGRLVEELGATILFGEEVRDFRYAVARVGTADQGMNLEVLEPTGSQSDNFLHQFLVNSGEGPHHISFTVPNIDDTLTSLRGLNLVPIKVKLDWTPWQEAFLRPEHGHGTVVQVASTAVAPLSMDEAIAAANGQGAEPVFQRLRDGFNRHWWRPQFPCRQPSFLDAVILDTIDLPKARLLFSNVLGGTQMTGDDSVARLTWPNGASLVLRQRTRTGVASLELRDAVSDLASTNIAGTSFQTPQQWTEK